MSEDLQQLLVDLRGSDVSLRRRAAERVATLLPNDPRITIAILDAVTDDDDQVREWVTAALEGMVAPDPKEVAKIVERVRGESADRSYWAATLLGRLGSSASAAVGTLADVLEVHSSLATRERAAWALGKIGPSARAAIPALYRATQTKSPRLATLAKTAITCIDPDFQFN